MLWVPDLDVPVVAILVAPAWVERAENGPTARKSHRASFVVSKGESRAGAMPSRLRAGFSFKPGYYPGGVASDPTVPRNRAARNHRVGPHQRGDSRSAGFFEASR